MSAASYDLNDPFDFRSLDRYRSEDGSSEDLYNRWQKSSELNDSSWSIVTIAKSVGNV